MGRRVAPMQTLLPVVVQLTSQFVRAVRNGIFAQMPWKDILRSLRAATYASL